MHSDAHSEPVNSYFQLFYVLVVLRKIYKFRFLCLGFMYWTNRTVYFQKGWNNYGHKYYNVTTITESGILMLSVLLDLIWTLEDVPSLKLASSFILNSQIIYEQLPHTIKTESIKSISAFIASFLILLQIFEYLLT